MDEEGEVLPEILTHIADKLVEDHQLEDIDTGIFKWALQLRHRYIIHDNYINLDFPPMPAGAWAINVLTG